MNVKVEGLDGVIAALKDYRDSLPAKKKALLWRLGELGVNTANIKFSTAQYAGTNDATVSARWVDDNKLEVVGSGHSVLFIEFGSGVFYDTSYPNRPPGMEIGEYGQGRGKNSYWFYKEREGHGRGTLGVPSEKYPGMVYTHGNPAARAMYQAAVDMRAKIAEIAKEVYES